MFCKLHEYFQDSVLQAPTIGAMLMCLVAALIGTFVVLRSKSLVGEALSHACYPGVIIALCLEQYFFSDAERELSIIFSVLVGATISALLGVFLIDLLEKRFSVKSDAALSFVLSSFFGVGILLLSALQQDHPTLYKELQAYLFGQVATMRSIHVLIYALFAGTILLFILVFFRDIQAVLFDPVFSEVSGIKRKRVEILLFCSLVASVIIGIRTCGIVLMSAMLIFPAVSARFFTHKLSTLLILAGLFALFSGFFGVVFSHEASLYFDSGMGGKVVSFPTGPMIVLCAAAIFFIAILFSGRNGLVFKLYRKIVFSWHCEQENLLKIMWKISSKKGNPDSNFQEIEQEWHRSTYSLRFVLFLLQRRGWIKKRMKNEYELTSLGMLWGRKIVRLHRLWEVYLVEMCKVAKDRVHLSAEEMEHVITPSIEKELTIILQNPRKDPHNKPIPQPEESFLLGKK